MVAAGLGAVLLAPASHAATASARAATLTPKLPESCPIPAFASARYLISRGHAVSGTWTLSPRITCDTPKLGITIGTTLIRNGVAQLYSSGACHWKRDGLCTSAAGPRRTKSYSTSIRGTWTAHVTYTITGVDAIAFARSSPAAGTCTFAAKVLTARCHYDTAPIVIT